jgi:hypothetical protein
MKKTMMYLPEELHRFLATEAKARDVSMAQIARDAISEYRSSIRAERPSQVQAIIGVVSDGPRTDAAAELDAHLPDEDWEAWAREKGLRDRP